MIAEHVFMDATKPQHPLALGKGVAYDVVRTEVIGMGYDEEKTDERVVRFVYYVKRKGGAIQL